MKNFIFISPNFPIGYYKFVEALKNKGFRVLGIGDSPYFDLLPQLRNSLTEYYLCQNMNNFDNEKEAVRFFKEKYGLISNLESNNEYWLLKDAELRTIFNVENGLRNEEAIIYRSKIAQKEKFAEAGIKCARFIKENDYESILNFSKKVGFPLFTKPDDGMGCLGTMKINNEDDVKNFIDKKDPNVHYIVEQYIDGKIISFDGMTNSKADLIWCAEDNFLVNNEDLVKGADNGYYINPFVSEKFKELGQKVVKAVNLKQRYFHIEFFILNKDYEGIGKKGDRIPLEVNARPAGAHTPDMHNFAHSFSVYNIFADILMNDETTEKLDGEKYYCISSIRRNNIKYKESHEAILNKYKNNICFHEALPAVLAREMGDYHYTAKFKTLDEMFEFDNFVRGKIQ